MPKLAWRKMSICMEEMFLQKHILQLFRPETLGHFTFSTCLISVPLSELHHRNLQTSTKMRMPLVRWPFRSFAAAGAPKLRAMALTNFLITLIGMGSVVYLMKKDLRTGSSMLRQNLKTIRGWLEEQGAAASSAAKEEAKQIDGKLKNQSDKVKPPD